MTATNDPKTGKVVDASGNLRVPSDYRTAYQFLGSWAVAADQGPGSKEIHLVYASPGAAAAYRLVLFGNNFYSYFSQSVTFGHKYQFSFWLTPRFGISLSPPKMLRQRSAWDTVSSNADPLHAA